MIVLHLNLPCGFQVSENSMCSASLFKLLVAFWLDRFDEMVFSRCIIPPLLCGLPLVFSCSSYIKNTLTDFITFSFFSPLQLQPDAVLILYNFSGQCSGEALITFPSEEIARQAVAERSNHPFYGQQVHLAFCNWPLALHLLPPRSI